MSTRPTPDADSPDPRPGPAAGRAAAALGVPADAPPAAARAAFLRRLPSAGLRAPAAAWADAARQLLEYQPALAALEPALIERLVTPPRPAVTRRAAATAAPSWGIRVQGGVQVPRVPRPAPRSGGWANW